MYKAMHQSMRESDKLAGLSDFAFRVWEMGCVASDMTGRITANPKKFWAQAMPMVAFDEAKYAAAFKELKGLVHFYEVDGKQFMVFHDHDEHNKGTRNLRNLRPSCPPPPPSLCICVSYSKSEEEGDFSAGCKSLIRRENQPHEGGASSAVPSADASAVPSAGVHVQDPSPVLVPVSALEEDGGLEEGEKWPPMPATTRGHLWRLFTKAHIQGTPSQKRQWFEGWLAQAGPERFEQILMERRIVGKDGFMIQKWYFNDMLKEAK